MRGVFVAHWLSSAGGGISRAVEALSAEVGHQGCDVKVLGLRDSLWRQEQASWRGSDAVACSLAGPQALGIAPSLPRLLRSTDPEFVHTHGLWMHPSRNVLKWSRATGRPYMVSPHGMLDPWAVARSPKKKRLAKWLYESSHLRFAACLHALCGSEADAIRAAGLKNPICVVPNGVTLPPKTMDGRPPWEGRIPENARVLLFLGRLHPKKNLLALVKAIGGVSQLQASGGAPWHIVIAGGDELGHARELQRRVAELGLGGRFTFTGPLREKAKDAALRHASAFILPSFSEGLPIAVLEAWSYGLPVLMTSASNLPIGFERGAALEITCEPQLLSAQLEAFFSLQDETLREMGKRGRKLVESHFTWDRVAGDMVAAYAWLLGQATAPSSVRFACGREP